MTPPFQLFEGLYCTPLFFIRPSVITLLRANRHYFERTIITQFNRGICDTTNSLGKEYNKIISRLLKHMTMLFQNGKKRLKKKKKPTTKTPLKFSKTNCKYTGRGGGWERGSLEQTSEADYRQMCG